MAPSTSFTSLSVCRLSPFLPPTSFPYLPLASLPPPYLPISVCSCPAAPHSRASTPAAASATASAAEERERREKEFIKARIDETVRQFERGGLARLVLGLVMVAACMASLTTVPRSLQYMP